MVKKIQKLLFQSLHLSIDRDGLETLTQQDQEKRSIKFIFGTETDSQTQRMNLWLLAGEGGREGIVREFGIDMYILLYLKRLTNKDLLYSTGNSAQCYVAGWMGGSLGEEQIHIYILYIYIYIYIYIWLSRFTVHLKLSQHC